MTSAIRSPNRFRSGGVLTEEDKQNLFDIKTIQIEMLRDRGFNVKQTLVRWTDYQSQSFWRIGDEETFIKNFQTFDMLYSRSSQESGISFEEALSSIYEKVTPQGEKERTYVFFAPTESDGQMSQKTAEKFIEFLRRDTATLAILITGRIPSATARGSLKEDYGTKIQVFFHDELIYNITRHVLTPKHELLSPDEMKKFYNDMNSIPGETTKAQNLPRILEGDPVIKYYGWLAGGVVRITRRNIGVATIPSKQFHYSLITPGEIPAK